MFFVQDWRARIIAENPEASFGEVGKLLGARWKEMPDAEKKVRTFSCLVISGPASKVRGIAADTIALQRPGRKGQGSRCQGKDCLRRVPRQGEEVEEGRVSRLS